MAPSRRHHTIHMLYQHTSYAQAVAEFIRLASTGSGSREWPCAGQVLRRTPSSSSSARPWTNV